MDENTERFYNYLIHFFDGLRRVNAIWYLDKETLAEFVCNKKFPEKIQIGLIKITPEYFVERCEAFNVRCVAENNKEFRIVIFGKPVNVKIYTDIPPEFIINIQEPEFESSSKDQNLSKEGIWRYTISELHSYNFPVPYKSGSYLDMILPLWFTKIKYVEKENTHNKFFTSKRIGNALELMALLKECATVAGFPEYIFPGFGTLLGIIRENNFILNDRDLDHCIMGNKITKEQEEKFLIEVARQRTIDGKLYLKGLYEGRKRAPQRRRDNGRFLWTSCGHKHIHGESGVKSCVWKFFEHNGYMWHSKGRKWINPRKFNKRVSGIDYREDAIAKGMPKHLLNEFIQMDFHGIKINVPKLAGGCLDFWYPGWMRPKAEKSSAKYVMVIPEWNNPKGWYLT